MNAVLMPCKEGTSLSVGSFFFFHTCSNVNSTIIAISLHVVIIQYVAVVVHFIQVNKNSTLVF